MAARRSTGKKVFGKSHVIKRMTSFDQKNKGKKLNLIPLKSGTSAGLGDPWPIAQMKASKRK